MNPAVTVAVWLMDVFPGASVLPYIVAQLAGSVVGVAVGRLVWGPVVSSPQIHDTAVMPAPGWTSSAVFVAEVACLIVLTLAVGFLLAYPQFSPLLPATVGTVIAVTIIILGPLSGGSANPIRQFGPALLSGRLTDFWIYMVGPILGAALGASVHHLLYQRLQVRAPLTYRLTGAKQAPAHPGLPSAAADGRG